MTISKDAFETQVLAILGPLHGVARRLTRNDADAEDLVAESVTRAWRARASLADGGAFRAWIFRILNNTFLSGARRVNGYTASLRMSSRYGSVARLRRPVLANNVIRLLETRWPAGLLFG